jgi:hypothetical protein
MKVGHRDRLRQRCRWSRTGFSRCDAASIAAERLSTPPAPVESQSLSSLRNPGRGLSVFSHARSEVFSACLAKNFSRFFTISGGIG